MNSSDCAVARHRRWTRYVAMSWSYSGIWIGRSCSWTGKNLRSIRSMSSKGRHSPDGGSALGRVRLYSLIASDRVNSLIGFSDIGGIPTCPRVKSVGGEEI